MTGLARIFGALLFVLAGAALLVALAFGFPPPGWWPLALVMAICGGASVGRGMLLVVKASQ